MRVLKPWLYSSGLLFALLTGCAKHEPQSTAELLRRLPAERAAIMRVDVDALRKAGVLNLLLAGKSAVDSEYQSFIDKTGFNYQRDLDEVLASFSPAGTFLIVKGRFDWPKLAAYAGNNGGSCYDRLCRMPGSVPERRISYLPLGNNVMAMAIGTDDLAATRMTKEAAPLGFDVPGQPLWVRVSGGVLRDSKALPPATRIFTAALGVSEWVTMTLGPASDNSYEARLAAECKNAEDARILTVQLTKLTEMLKGLMGKAKAEDFAGAIAAGSFSQSGTKVTGVWPIRKALLESLAGAN